MLTIIGCGNPNRTDDGVGVEVIRRLAALGRGQTHGSDPVSADPVRAQAPRVRLFDAGTDGMGVMFRARGATALIVVDACQSGSEPGVIFEVPGAELEATPPDSLNLHDFRWQHALFAGRKIWKDDFPTNVVVYLIEAQSIAYGIGLTPAVARAAETVAGRIEKRIFAEGNLGSDSSEVFR